MNFSFAWTGIRNYAIALVIFLAIDIVWLTVISKTLYAQHLGYLIAPKAKLLAALLFYLLFVLGLQFFVLNPALASGSWKMALFAGMFFGLVTYATYDLTNLATIKNWPVLIGASRFGAGGGAMGACTGCGAAGGGVAWPP